MPVDDTTRERKRAYDAARYAERRETVKARTAAYYAANRDAARGQQAAYGNAHREQIAANGAAWYAANRKKVARSHADNREHLAAYQVAYRKADPVRHQSTQAARRALKLGAPVCDLTRKQWDAIKAAFEQRCVYCGQQPGSLTQDHLIPLTRGGSHTASNVVPACRPCNSRKHDGPPPVPVQPLLLV